MINLASNEQISILLFSGYIKEEVVEPVLNELGVEIVIKTGPNRGKVKTRKATKERYIQGLGLTPQEGWKNKKGYSVDEKVLSELAKGQGEGAKIASLMLELRSMQKEYNTYYKGFDKYLDTDSCVHGSLDHCNNITARTNSSRPNLQNISN